MSRADPSLAAGITKRFIREQPNKVRELLDFLGQRYPEASRSKKRWNKFVSDLHKHDSTILNSYLGGTSNRPYLCLELLTVGNWNPMLASKSSGEHEQGWDESMLVARRTILPFKPRTFHDEDFSDLAPFTISHHAVSRLLERSTVYNENYDLLIERVLNEMKYIGLWSSIWRIMAASANLASSGSQLEFFIPSQSGMYLAKLHQYGLFVRTYIDEDHLFQDQLDLRDALLSASDKCISSPLSFFPEIEMTGREPGCMVIVHLLLHRIRDHIPDIVEAMTRKIDSSETENDLVQAANLLLEESGITIEQWHELDALARKNGITPILRQARKGRGKIHFEEN
jgi:hypothetical protein